MSTILVYRDEILPRSEIAFMRRQYMSFAELRPLWVGRRLRPWLEPGEFPRAAVWGGVAGLRFKLTGAVPDLRALRALAPTLVHAQFGRGGALALPLAARLGVPLVVTFHGGDVHKSSHFRRFPPALFRLRMAWLMRGGERFVCVAESVRQRLIGRGFPAERTVVVPIGTDRIDPAPRADAGGGVLFVGRFVEMKGLDVLVDAIRLLRADGFEQRFTLIGDGPERARIGARLAGVPGVELSGWRDAEQVRAAMRAARMVVVPSVVARSGEAEGLPSVAVEAMGVGTPVIASSDAGLEGVVTHGESGLVFASREAAALARCIATLAAAPEQAATLGEAGRALVAREFDAARQSAKLQALLRDVISAGTPRCG